MMARAITTTERGLMRSDSQWSKLFLFIYTPEVVFSGQVENVPPENDKVTEIAYHNGAGTLGNVIDGMTLMVGSTAGGSDLGFARVRAIDANNITLGEVSNIVWAVDQYLTIIDDFEVWARKLNFLGGAYELEGETPYTDQYTAMIPVVVMGPYLNTLKLAGGSVSLVMDGSASWVPGDTIDSYLWTGNGPAAVTFDDDTASAPTVTFSQVGNYRIRCAATVGTQTGYGYRYVYVYDDSSPLTNNFMVERIEGSNEGFSYKVQIYDPLTISAARSRAMVALVAEDHYGNTIQSIGPVAGYEHVVTLGRIETGSVKWNPELSQGSFGVQGPAWWLSKATNWPFTLMDTAAVAPGAPDQAVDWLHMEDLTVDKAIWCWAVWRSTAALCMDIYPTGDTRPMFSASGNLGGFWEQLKSFSDQVTASPRCDRYGRLFVEVDPQMIEYTERNALPVVMDVANLDWTGDIDIERREYAVCGWFETAGFYFDGRFQTMLSSAPGNALGQFGNKQNKNNLLFASQAQANTLTGRLLTRVNNEYPAITVRLAGNNRMIDVAPRQYCTLTVTASDTPYGVAWTKRIIPRRVSYVFDPEAGTLEPEIEFEAETLDGPAVTVTQPSTPKPNKRAGGGEPNPPFKLPKFGWGPIVIPQPPLNPQPVDPPGDDCLSTSPANGPWDTWMRGTYTNDAGPNYGNIPCTIRAAGSPNQSRYVLKGKFYARNDSVSPWVPTLDDTFYSINGVSRSGGTLVTGIKDPVSAPGEVRSGVFGPLAATEIYAIKLDMGGDAIDLDGVPTGNISEPQCGLGQSGSIYYQSTNTIQSTPKAYVVLNASIICGGCGNLIYHGAIIEMKPNPALHYTVRLRASGSRMRQLEFYWYPYGTYGHPVYQVGTTQYNTSGYEATTVAVPQIRFLGFEVKLWWDPDQTTIFRWDVEVTPVATRRIDIDSLALYNVCPPA
jgi:hypothetical protein